MPKNEEFSFRILLGGEPVTEYMKDGETFIMTNLMHPTTYQEERLEFVDGREERQKIPVTPYQVAITLKSFEWQQVWAKLYVDGSFVKNSFLQNGKEFVVKGFNDAGNTREFLFSLPRFGRDKDDRIEEGRISKVGCISVELYLATFKGVENSKRSRIAEVPLDYTQATKKDSCKITKGKFTMATTKPGRCIETNDNPGSKRKYDNGGTQNIWYIGQEILSKLNVKSII